MVFIKDFEITTGKNSLDNITASVNEAIKESGIQNGIAVIETAHSTAGILMISSYGKEILDDIVTETRRIVPARINFSHQDAPEDSAGHIKSALFGSSVSLIVKEGKLLCEGKQDVYFAEYDGPRQRAYSVCVNGEKEG